MPYDQILTLIQDKSSLSKEEIEQKITAKLDQLSGLISKEGAAHIIANELGVQLEAAQGGAGAQGKVKIKEIAVGARNIQTIGRVVQKYELREFNSNGREGKVANFLLGDESGVMRVVMWNAVADNLAKLTEKDIVKISGAYARMNQNRVELHLNDNSVLEINPSGETVADVAQQRSEFTRKKITELTEADQETEILGTIVQVFDPRFFEVDPNSGKRIRPRDDNIFYNESGQPVNPDYSYVFNLFVDDGTDNMRIVCFKNQMQRVLNKNHEEVLAFRTNPQGFESAKHDLLGKMVKVQGRIVRNEMFDRLEMISARIYTDVNPQAELNKMNDTKKESESKKPEPTQSVSAEPKAEQPTVTQAAPTAPAAMSLDDLETSSSSTESSTSTGASISTESGTSTGASISTESSINTETVATSEDNTEYTPDVSEVPKDQLDFKSGSEVPEPVATPEEKKSNASVDDLGELDDLEELDSFDDM